jgi:hypothetical protein
LNPGLPGAFWPKSGQEEKTKSIPKFQKFQTELVGKIPVIDWNRGSKPVFRIRNESGFNQINDPDRNPDLEGQK